MQTTAKLFLNGKSQAVRLPRAFRFDANEVFIRQDSVTGDVILSKKPADWDSFLALVKDLDVPASFLSKAERKGVKSNRDPLSGIAD